MKAIIFAAGLGTRLKDITDDKPKALVEVNGVSLLEIALRKMKYFGFKDVIVNIHHQSEQIETFINNLRYDDLRITVSDESSKLLGTGGGIKKVSGFSVERRLFLHIMLMLSPILILVSFTGSILLQVHWQLLL